MFRTGFRFVVIEGIDGSGKSALIHGLERSADPELKACVLYEPTHMSRESVRIRAMLREKKTLTEEDQIQLLDWFYLDRQWNTRHHIIPAIQAGRLVLEDRYWPSTVAYQSADEEAVRKITDFYLADEVTLQPEIVLYLDIEPETASARIAERNPEREVFETTEQLRRVHRNYESLWSRELPFPVVKLDASMELETVLQEAIGILSA